LKKKGFKEERVTKVGLDAIGTSTTLESNKSLEQYVKVLGTSFWFRPLQNWHSAALLFGG
jgi:hypothetical protein